MVTSLGGRGWLVLLWLMVVGAQGAPEAREALPNSFAPLPARVAATMENLLSENFTDRLEIGVPLPLRHFPELQARIARGEIVSRAELERVYLPLPVDYELVKKWLQGQGLTITHEDASRLGIFAEGTVAQIQQSLQVEMVGVTVSGRHFHAANSPPSLPASIAAQVLGINGLQPYQHRLKHATLAVPTSKAPPFLIGDILGAYHANNLGVTGANEKIAILIDTFPADSDLTAFWTANGIPQSLNNIEKIQVNSGTLPAVSGEETLDVEWSSGLAPAAKVRIYASRTLNDSDLDKAFQRIINDLPTQPQLHQLSISLGLGETYSTSSQFNTDTQLLATIAASGVTIFVSSGDGGATPDYLGGTAGPLQVEYYASDPNVTAVGGTSLYVNATTGAKTGESAWSGSGGGTSVQFARPAWQAGPGVPAGTKRLVPDVSLPADPNTGAYVFLNGAIYQFGGTSWGAPAWAGLCALINEARAQHAQTPVGFLNANLYPLIGTDNFFDVTSGSNATSTSAGKYAAGANYDEVTGIGAPHVANLLNTLVAAVPALSSFNPASGVVYSAVTLTGVNFANVSSVTFNGVSAPFTVDSTHQITATVPAGAVSGPIRVAMANGTVTSASSFTVVPAPANAVVISQIFGSGGFSGAAYLNDYIELFNYGTSVVNLGGWSVQYASATGSSWVATNLSGLLAPGHYYLVKEASNGSTGSALPTADATGSINLNSSKGKVALLNTTAVIVAGTASPLGSSALVDFAGYGSTSAYEGTGPAPTLAVTTAALRRGGGYNDTNDNFADFTAAAPNPHNSSYVSASTQTSLPDLTIAISHSGNFTQGDVGDAYTITVTNNGTAVTAGSVNVADTLPAGLVATDISGVGWTSNLNSLTATRADALGVGAAYPPLIVTVNVATTAAASVTNQVTVSGGGEVNTGNDNASDNTTIIALSPVQSWRLQYFHTTANTGASADTAIESGDGLPNLLKYAFGLNPLVPAVSPATMDHTTGYLRLTVPRNPNATDISFSAEVTSDLAVPASWTSNGTTVDQNTPTLFQAHDNTPVGSGGPRFIRLKVSRP